MPICPVTTVFTGLRGIYRYRAFNAKVVATPRYTLSAKNNNSHLPGQLNSRPMTHTLLKSIILARYFPRHICRVFRFNDIPKILFWQRYLEGCKLTSIPALRECQKQTNRPAQSQWSRSCNTLTGPVGLTLHLQASGQAPRSKKTHANRLWLLTTCYMGIEGSCQIAQSQGCSDWPVETRYLSLLMTDQGDQRKVDDAKT
jgi:hypothetical protein